MTGVTTGVVFFGLATGRFERLNRESVACLSASLSIGFVGLASTGGIAGVDGSEFAEVVVVIRSFLISFLISEAFSSNFDLMLLCGGCFSGEDFLRNFFCFFRNRTSPKLVWPKKSFFFFLCYGF